MRVLVVGKEAQRFRSKLPRRHFEVVTEDPDLVIAYGGDGTLIGAELDYPEIPKLGVRSDTSCIKCPAHEEVVMIERLVAGDLPEQRLMKIEADCNESGVWRTALNDIMVRNEDPQSAVRFIVLLNGQRITEELIGDGLVAATAFGSSAYFRSITRVVTRVGIGVAFNNCSDLLNHLVLAEDDLLEVLITRGPGLLCVDNSRETIRLDRGDMVKIRRSAQVSRILAVDSLRCAECRYVHAPRRRY